MEILNGIHSAGQKPCGTWRNSEDWMSYNDRHIGVYDGATPAAKALYMGRDGFTDASWISQTTASIVKNSIQKFGTLSTCEKPVKHVYSRLRAVFQNATHLDIAKLEPFQRPATTMSLVVEQGDYLRFIQVGDSPIGIVLKNGEVRVMEGDSVLLQNDKNISTELHSLRSKYPDASHKDILEQRALPRIRHLMNATNDGYGVMTPQNPDKIYVQQQIIHKSDVEGFVVLTDGLAEAYDTFDLFKDAKHFVKTIVQQPEKLQVAHKKLRILQNKDPECKAIPRIKMGDDIASIIARPS
jgi:serine/threonine protein phosphatase PrpC